MVPIVLSSPEKMLKIRSAVLKDKSDETLDILSDMFNVPKEDMQDLTMSEIVEIYGEEWQINAMKEAVGNKYKEIRVLTDDSCRGDYLMDAVEEFAGKEYYVDMVFSLHAGSSKVICFSDRNYSIDEFTNFLKSNNYYIRSLYQTCCYGSYFFDDWTNAGMIALNGSVKANGINIFSPIFFLQEWVGNGLDFKSAVKKAFDREIEKLMTYNDILPIEDFFLQPSTLEDSKMLTSGIYDKLLWKDFPVDKSNKPGV